LRGDRQIDFKVLKKELGMKKLTFEDHDGVRRITGCAVGGVPPFGSIFGL